MYTPAQAQLIAKTQIIQELQEQIEFAQASKPNALNVQTGTLIDKRKFVETPLLHVDLEPDHIKATILAPGRLAPYIPEEKQDIADTTIDPHAETLPALYTGANGRIYYRDTHTRYEGLRTGEVLRQLQEEHDPYCLAPEFWNNGIPDPAMHVVTKDSVHSLHVAKFRAIGYVLDERGYVYVPIQTEKPSKKKQKK